MSERQIVVVFLVSKNVDSLVPFYRDVLGLKVAEYRPGHSVWFDTGSTRLAIHVPEEGGAGRDFLPDEGIVIWLRPGEGVAAARETLATRDVQILSPESGQNYFYLRDPEGRLIGFHEPA